MTKLRMVCSMLVLAVLVVALSVVATGSTKPAAAVAASTQPILIGAISQEGTVTGSVPEGRMAEAAAVKYINQKFGGVNGRKLQLKSCVTDGTAAGSAACASGLVAQKVISVSEVFDAGTAGSVPVLEKAKVPIVGGSPSGDAAALSKNSFFFGPGSSNVTGRVAFAKETLKAKSAVVLTINVPAAVFQLNTIKAGLTKAGITKVTTITVPATTTDWTPVVAQVAAKKPDVFFPIVPLSQCANVFRDLHQLGVTPKTKVVTGSTCGSVQVVTAAGNDAMNGVYVGSDFGTLESKSPDIKTLTAAMKRYAPAAQLDTFVFYGFQAVMNEYLILKEMSDKKINLTSKNLITAFHGTKNHRDFLGYKYTCNARQIRGFPAICSPYMRIWQFKGTGFQELGNWYDAEKYL